MFKPNLAAYYFATSAAAVSQMLTVAVVYVLIAADTIGGFL